MPRTFKLILMATGIFSRNFLESLYQGPASPKPVLQRKLFLKHRRDNLVMCGLVDFLAIVDGRVKQQWLNCYGLQSLRYLLSNPLEVQLPSVPFIFTIGTRWLKENYLPFTDDDTGAGPEVIFLRYRGWTHNQRVDLQTFWSYIVYSWKARCQSELQTGSSVEKAEGSGGVFWGNYSWLSLHEDASEGVPANNHHHLLCSPVLGQGLQGASKVPWIPVHTGLMALYQEDSPCAWPVALGSPP